MGVALSTRTVKSKQFATPPLLSTSISERVAEEHEFIYMLCIYNLTELLLYTGFFSPRVIFGPFHLQTPSPRLEFAKTQFCLKRDNLRHRNLPSFKYTRSQRGQK